jgi:hypothetical protein
MNKKHVGTLLTAMIAFTLTLSGQAGAVPTNGDFSTPGLAGWEHSGEVIEAGGFAMLFENIDGDRISSLWQEFTMPDNAQNLTFERFFYYGGGSPTSDTFSVLLTTLSDNVETQLYSLDSDEVEQPEGSSSGDMVTLDVSMYSNKAVRLTFMLYSDPADEGSSSVSLDNIEISSSTPSIPAPGALLMAIIGTTLVSWFGRTKQLP